MFVVAGREFFFNAREENCLYLGILDLKELITYSDLIVR